MAKRKRKLSAEEHAALEASYRETVRKLEERINYHRSKREQKRPVER